MKSKKLALAGVLALGAAWTFAMVPGFADPQAGDPYTQNPTPAEKQQTDQLNSQAGIAAKDQSDASTTNAAQQQQYQDQKAHYDVARQAYEEELQRYRGDRYYDDYRHAERASIRAHAHWDEVALLSRTDLYKLHDPVARLTDLDVNAASGYRVGRVSAVHTNADGSVETVEIALTPTRVALVRPDHLRLDVPDNIVLTDLTSDQLWDMSEVR